MENANSESEVLGLGLSVIALNLGMYLGVPAAVIVGIRKESKIIITRHHLLHQAPCTLFQIHVS